MLRTIYIAYDVQQITGTRSDGIEYVSHTIYISLGFTNKLKLNQNIIKFNPGYRYLI